MRIPPPLVRYLELYRAGAYWESHEALEGAWRESRSGFYHGLILLSSALVHAQRANAHGVRAQARKAAAALAPYRPAYLGLDVEAILAALAQWRAAAGAPDWAAGVRAPDLVPEAALIRGDEPELTGA